MHAREIYGKVNTKDMEELIRDLAADTEVEPLIRLDFEYNLFEKRVLERISYHGENLLDEGSIVRVNKQLRKSTAFQKGYEARNNEQAPQNSSLTSTCQPRPRVTTERLDIYDPQCLSDTIIVSKKQESSKPIESPSKAPQQIFSVSLDSGEGLFPTQHLINILKENVGVIKGVTFPIGSKTRASSDSDGEPLPPQNKRRRMLEPSAEDNTVNTITPILTMSINSHNGHCSGKPQDEPPSPQWEKVLALSLNGFTY